MWYINKRDAIYIVLFHSKAARYEANYIFHNPEIWRDTKWIFFGDMCLPIFITIALHELFIKSLKLFINKHVTR